MSYYKFDANDVFVNTLRLYPDVKFVIYSGSSYLNATPDISGAFTSSIRLTSPGDISLYELNVDRNEYSTGDLIGLDGLENRNIIYPWIIKDGSRLNFRTSTTEAFANELPGAVITGSMYPYTASISKEYYSSTTPRFAMAVVSASSVSGDDPEIESYGSVSHLLALKNTINYYRYLSPHFEYSSSADSVSSGLHSRDLESADVGLVSIPSIFYGKKVKKGTVTLEIYYTGSLIARAQDTKQNGELIQTYGVGTTINNVIGLVLYNEGFVILTSSAALATVASTDNYTGTSDQPRWTYFAQSISGSIIAPKTTFVMNMSGTTETQVMTMFATAPKGELNHSNNPSYLQTGSAAMVSTGSTAYIQSEVMPIKNVVSSAYADPTGSFEKTTYISKVGIYDKNKNLIGLAKVATPVRKTVERDFTFKIKLDI